MKSVEDLDVFKLAHQLALKTYSTTKNFRKEYRQFVGIARGSAGEVCYQLLLARDLKYVSSETYQELRSGYDRVIQMLSRLSQSLNR